eukprot:CAMPEP_0185477898 /NCGR_PEP_ID=MMETSP1366-20130426/4360_1 /TAXON_ID=38817 /ORGANISM="Gephyrocapsa oceanica, Strain RCC1303" /LENGTH=150 /DNA_ID=CAMNT_0028085105 /DNA_START=920 /DNA_END=1372 /DNA_ORIENTATION=+
MSCTTPSGSGAGVVREWCSGRTSAAPRRGALHRAAGSRRRASGAGKGRVFTTTARSIAAAVSTHASRCPRVFPIDVNTLHTKIRPAARRKPCRWAYCLANWHEGAVMRHESRWSWRSQLNGCALATWGSRAQQATRSQLHITARVETRFA